jgi:hypothetical protein
LNSLGTLIVEADLLFRIDFQIVFFKLIEGLIDFDPSLFFHLNWLVFDCFPSVLRDDLFQLLSNDGPELISVRWIAAFNRSFFHSDQAAVIPEYFAELLIFFIS